MGGWSSQLRWDEGKLDADPVCRNAVPCSILMFQVIDKL
jgi:hypothetical protein